MVSLTIIDERLATPNKDYNIGVDVPVPPKPVAENKDTHRPTIYAAEATGLLVMAILLVVLIVVRYWKVIPWSAR